VVFALDASGSILLDNFQRMTQFVALLVQTLDIDSVASGPSISRVGVVTYSDSAVLQFHLNRYTTKAALMQAVNVPYLTGTSKTADAIRFTNYCITCKVNLSLSSVLYAHSHRLTESYQIWQNQQIQMGKKEAET